MKLTLNRLRIISVLLLSVLILSFLISRINLNNLINDFTWVDHTEKVLLKIESIRSELKEVETNIRGYIVTGDKNFVEQFPSKETRIKENYKNLIYRTSDNLHQQQHLNQLKPLLEKKLEIFRLQMAKRNEGITDLSEITKNGQLITEKIDILIQKIEQEELKLLEVRTSKVEQSRGWAKTIIDFGGIFALILLGLLLNIMVKEIRRRIVVEKELREKDQTLEKVKDFEFLADSVPILIWTCKANGELDYFNRLGHEYSGIKREEINHTHWLDLMHPDDRDQAIGIWIESLSSGKSFQMEFRLKGGKEGIFRWHIGRISPMLNDQGKIIKWFGTCTDIHNQKQNEKILKEQNKELNTFRELAIDEMQKKSQVLNGILSNMPVEIFRMDRNGFIVEHIGSKNRHKGLLTFQKKRESVFSALPEWKEKAEAALNGDSQVINMEGTEGGKEWYEEKYLFPDTVSNKGILGFSIDVTERKISERKIKENEEKFRGLLESAPDAIIIANERGEIEIVNTQTMKLFGYSKEELVGNKIEAIIPDRFAVNHTDHRNSYFSNPKARLMGESRELFAKRKDGSQFPVEVSLSPLQVKEGLLVSAAIRDVTERKMAEKELQQAKILAEKANEFKSSFLANMSHEIRTPLNAILGFAEVLKKPNLKAEQQQEFLEYIKSSGNLLLKLIGDILDLSKIEEGKLELHNESFCLKENVSSVILPYKFKANEKGLDFDLSIDASIPDYVYGDSYRINQIIINLIGNSLKFTSDGRITVNVSNLSENTSNDKVNIKISVSDTGIGIPREKQELVFESFTQADNSVVKAYGGSGLGLAIVKQLVHLMGGKIRISSPVTSDMASGAATGTSVEIFLTLKTDRNRVVPTAANDTTKTLLLKENIKVLVVEDNLVNQRLAKVVLNRIGCTPDFANNGQEAIEMYSANQYSIIFMDVHMPVMNGYNATQVLRNDLNCSIPIIGLTANVFKEDIDKCINAGMNDFLGKPYSESQIFEMIRKWISTN